MLFIVPLNWCWWTRVWLVRFPSPLGSWGTWPRSDWERSHCWGFLFSGFRNIWARKAERAIEVEKTKTVWSFSSSIMIISFSLKSTSLTFFHIWISWKLLFPTMPHHILLLGQAWGEDESKTWGKLGGGWKAAASQGSGDMMMIIKLFFLFVQTNFQTKTP